MYFVLVKVKNITNCVIFFLLLYNSYTITILYIRYMLITSSILGTSFDIVIIYYYINLYYYNIIVLITFTY